MQCLHITAQAVVVSLIQKFIFENKQTEDNEHKKKQQFRAKLESLSSWLQDQWNLISHLGKISADPVVLEQQMIQAR